MNQRPCSTPSHAGDRQATALLPRHGSARLRRGLPSALMPGLKLLAPLALGLVLATGAVVRAEPDPTPVADPPARVGRVGLLLGRIDTSSAPGAAWEPARLNQPVTTQTAFWAPPGSQAELRVGSSSVRLGGNTQAVFSQLDDHGVAIDLAQGTVRARVRNLPTGDAFSLSADGVRAEALQPGDYRVSHDPDRRSTTVRALSGRLRVVTPSNSLNLEAGQESVVEAGGASLQLRPLSGRDDFDRWAEARDREQDRLAALRHVSPEMTGVESLDEYGVWDRDGQYGTVWYPSALPPGWAPYRHGRWAWVSPWGWTWVDDSPWGFAPFHYGRWALIGQRWAWVPGPLNHRPVWAPALVGYVGGRSGSVGWSVGIGAPAGWVPLAPHEVYRPPYRHSVTYVNQINIIHPPPAPSPAPATAPRPPGRPWRASEGMDTGLLPSGAPAPKPGMGGPAVLPGTGAPSVLPGAGGPAVLPDAGAPPVPRGTPAQPANPVAPFAPSAGGTPIYRHANRPDTLTITDEDGVRPARPGAGERFAPVPRHAAEPQSLTRAAPGAPAAPFVPPAPSPGVPAATPVHTPAPPMQAQRPSEAVAPAPTMHAQRPSAAFTPAPGPALPRGLGRDAGAEDDRAPARTGKPQRRGDPRGEGRPDGRGALPLER